jgi:hypothetical protein
VSSKFKIRSLLFLSLMIALVLAAQTVVSAPPIPNPFIYLTGVDQYQQSGKTFNRYHYDVFNKDQFPAAMFAAAPALPPCGANTKSSRTWIDLYDQSGKRLYGFCALKSPGELNQIYFALAEGVIPPSWIYIELTDRQTNTKYKSNLAETSN